MSSELYTSPMLVYRHLSMVEPGSGLGVPVLLLAWYIVPQFCIPIVVPSSRDESRFLSVLCTTLML